MLPIIGKKDHKAANQNITVQNYNQGFYQKGLSIVFIVAPSLLLSLLPWTEEKHITFWLFTTPEGKLKLLI